MVKNNILFEKENPLKILAGKLYLQEEDTDYSRYISGLIPIELKDKDGQPIYSKTFIKNLKREPPDIINIENALPFMYSEDGGIVCVPKTRDPPRVGCLGLTGSGKTNTFLTYMYGLHYDWKEPLFIPNCVDNQSLNWNKPCNYERYMKLNWLIGRRKPMPLPIVNLYPISSEFLRPKEKDIDILKISLPWSEIVDNFSYFFKDIGKSGHYFSKLKGELKECKNMDEIKKVIYVGLGKVAKGSVAYKVIHLIEELYDDGVLDICSKESVAEVVLNKKDTNIKIEFDNVINALMYCNALPCIMTGEISDKYFDIYFNYLLEKIYKNQIKEGLFKQEKKIVYAFIDELQELTLNYKNTKETLIKYFTGGRNKKIGIFYCTQNFSVLPTKIKSNTLSVVCTRQGRSDAKEIVDEFGPHKHYIKDLQNLEMGTECIAFTKQEFLIYDIISNKIRYSSEPVRGRYIPPAVLTVPPRE